MVYLSVYLSTSLDLDWTGSKNLSTIYPLSTQARANPTVQGISAWPSSHGHRPWWPSGIDGYLYPISKRP